MTVYASKLERTLRLDSEYFRRSHVAAAQAIQSISHMDVAAVCSVSDGNHFTISEDFVSDGIPYYRGQDVVGNFFIEQSEPTFITEEAFNRPYMTRSHLKQGDVLLSIIGTIGELSLVGTNRSATCSCKLAILRPHSITPEYLAVSLRSKYGRLQIDRLTRGAVQMGLILEDMDQLLIPRLSDSLQKRVVDTVSKADHARKQSRQILELAENELAGAIGFATWSPPEPLAYISNSAAVRASERFDSQYFMPAKTEVIRLLAGLPGRRLGDAFTSVREIVDPQKDELLGLVRNFDVTHALEPVLDDEQAPIDFENLGSIKKRMRKGDLAISRLRSYLKEIAIVDCSDTIPVVGSSESLTQNSCATG